MTRVAYIIVVLIWSTTPLTVQWSAQSASPFFGAALRFAIASFIALSWVSYKRVTIPFDRNAIKLYFAANVGQTFALLCVYWASPFISSSLISVLFGLSPLVTGVLAFHFLGERLAFRQWLCIGAAFFGLFVIFSGDILAEGIFLKGIIFTLFATFLFCISNIMIKKVDGHDSVDPVVLTAGSLMFAFPIYLAFFGFDAMINPAVGLNPFAGTDASPFRVVSASIYLGLFGSVLAPVCYFWVLQRMSVSSVSLITIMTPIIAIFLGLYFNDEAFDVNMLLGSFAILVSLLIYNQGIYEALKLKLDERLANW